MRRMRRLNSSLYIVFALIGASASRAEPPEKQEAVSSLIPVKASQLPTPVVSAPKIEVPKLVPSAPALPVEVSVRPVEASPVVKTQAPLPSLSHAETAVVHQPAPLPKPVESAPKAERSD